MFTGLIEEIGKITKLRNNAGSTELQVGCSVVLDGLQVGDSVSVNGVCLTATSINDDSYTATATPETLARTNIGGLIEGSPVNLERSLTLQTRIGGHLVQGHIDGTAAVISREPEGDSERWTFSIPGGLAPYMILKGSVAINGVSLTIASLADTQFSVAIIPKTLEVTTFKFLKAGDTVNIEADLIGKYIHRLMETRQST